MAKKTVPNQKIIKINNNVEYPKEGETAALNERYGKVNKQCTFVAFKTLTPSAFGIYMYMVLQRNGHDFGLSQADIEKEMGIKRTAYISAVKELVENNYLIEMSKNHFMFVADNDEGKVRVIRQQIEERRVKRESWNVTLQSEQSVEKRLVQEEESVGMCTRNITYMNTTNIDITEDDVLFSDEFALKKYLVSVGVCDENFDCDIEFDTRIKDILTIHPEDFVGIYQLCSKNTKFNEIYASHPKIKHNVVYAINCICRQIREYYKTHFRVEEQQEAEEKEKRSRAYRYAQNNEYYMENGDFDIERAYKELYESEQVVHTQEEEQDADALRRTEEEEQYSMFIGLQWDDSDEAV